MPLRTEYIDFEEEIQSLQSDMEDLADEVAEMADDTPDQLIQQNLVEGNNLQSQINTLEALQAGDVTGVPAMPGVELGGLTMGEIDLVEDIVDKHANMRHRNAWVAVGTRSDAPYLAHDPDEPLSVGACEESAMLVADLPKPYVEWAEQRLSVLSRLEEAQGNGFLRLVQEKAAEE